MSDFVAAANALRTALQSFAALPLYWPNDTRRPALKDAPNGFVYSTIRLTDERAVTLGTTGNRTHRDGGEFVVGIYVPSGALVGTAEQHAQSVRALFGTSAVPGVTITSRSIGEGREVDGPYGRLWCVPLVVTYFSDRTE